MLQRNPETKATRAQDTGVSRDSEALARITYPPRVPRRDEVLPWVAVCLMLGAAWLVLVWPWLSGNVTVPWDAKGHFQAQVAFLADSLKRGDSPLWTPYVFSGHPQVADPQAMIFSPPHFLLAWLMPEPSFRAVDMTSFAMLLFGGLGVIGFARDRRWHPAAALIAALAFAFGGSASWRIQHVGQIMSMVYFPWALWMLERGLRLGSARYGALASVFTALMLLDPDQVAFLGVVCLAAYVIVYLLNGDGIGARLLASRRPLFVGLLVGLAIIAIPILMVLSFAEYSNRPHFTIADAEMGSLHPSSLFTLVIANLFGTIGPAEQYWGAPSTHWPYIVNSFIARNMANFYMGLLPLIGITIWLTTRPREGHRFTALGVCFVVMILYSLGRYTPLFGIFYNTLPGADLFRRPADSLFLVGTLGAFLAGFGLDLALKRNFQLPKSAKIALILLLAVAFAGSLWLSLWLEKFMYASREIATAAGFLMATCLAILAARKLGAQRPLAVTALFGLLLTADYAWNMRPNDSTGLPPAEYAALQPDTQDETVLALKSLIVSGEQRRDRVELTGLGFHWPNLGLVHRFENTLGYNPLRLKHYAAATGAEDHVAGADQHRFGTLFPSYRSSMANMLGLRYIALSAPIETVDPRMRTNPLPLVARTKDAYIYENVDAFPRVMVVPTAQIADQDQLIQSGQWPSSDFRTLAFVEKTSLPLPRTRTQGSAKIVSYANTEILIETDAPRGGVLVLHDIWHPWWFAEIDDKPTPMLRANGVFRAVILPAGVKQVRFSFNPTRGVVRRTLQRLGIIPG